MLFHKFGVILWDDDFPNEWKNEKSIECITIQYRIVFISQLYPITCPWVDHDKVNNCLY